MSTVGNNHYTTDGLSRLNLLKLLEITLPQFVDICFTANEVDYMLQHVKCAMLLNGYLLEPMIIQHMYDRISLAVPSFKEAWDAIEKYNDDPDKLTAIEEKYNASARLAMLIMNVNSITLEWREACPIRKLESE